VTLNLNLLAIGSFDLEEKIVCFQKKAQLTSLLLGFFMEFAP